MRVVGKGAAALHRAQRDGSGWRVQPVSMVRPQNNHRNIQMPHVQSHIPCLACGISGLAQVKKSSSQEAAGVASQEDQGALEA